MCGFVLRTGVQFPHDCNFTIGKSFMNLLSTHGIVLTAIARQPDIRLRELAINLDVTERTVWRAVEDLVLAGVVVRHKVGRRNSYTVNGKVDVGDHTGSVNVAALLKAVNS
ncbi:MAG TPA: winged helix-turn-helix domain-containing protein [Ilumatobacteraceae bacterium]|nr:winged helix-turn-helix domain-containing protein [Ilumatobacteraceae bacterium]